MRDLLIDRLSEQIVVFDKQHSHAFFLVELILSLPRQAYARMKKIPCDRKVRFRFRLHRIDCHDTPETRMMRRSLLNSLAVISLVTVCAGSAGMAAAEDACNVPLSDWKPLKELDAFASARGWNVTRIKADDGCYEVRGTDRQGRRFKAKLNPATLAIVRMKTDGDDRSHEGRGEHEGRHAGDAGDAGDAKPGTPNSAHGNPASTAAPPGGILTPGTRPQVQIQ
ncbi:PepSY domain-containing protein [Paraburkholderia heleia]|uniref:PepSY domain-containing protein n=1 Tax=Paraburkholderia heleia TaxID=634127 RepID=UPI001FE1B881|nr:PepSY domain-containing protein [Paraburkholderia heleia]